MADGVTVSSAATYDVATDEVNINAQGVKHVQYVKLADGANGGTSPIGGDATNGLDVDVTRMPATYAEDAAHVSGDLGIPALVVRDDSPPATSGGTDGDYVVLKSDNIGRLWVTTSGPEARSTVTPTISTTPAYSVGDQQGGVMTFTNAAAYNGGGFRIVNAVLTSRDTETPVLQLFLFRVSPTMVNTDNGAFDLTDANLEAGELIGIIDFASWYSTTSGRVAQGTYCGFPLGGSPLHSACGASTTSIYGVMQTRTANTPASTTDMVVTLTFEQE